MKKVLSISILTLLSILSITAISYAQNPVWLRSLSERSTAQNVVADKWGNSYVISLPGIRIDKVNKLGQFCWTRTLSGFTSLPKLSIMPDGGIIIAGKFTQTADLDPGSGILNFTAASSNGDIFVEKLDSAGTLQWCRTYGGSSYGSSLSGITVDKSGNVVFISNTPIGTDFDPGPGVVTTPNGGTMSICKLANNGSLIAVGNVSSNINCQSLSTDSENNILVAGFFIGQTDFDPGPGQYNIAASNFRELFALKLNSNFGFKWAKTFISPNVSAQSNIISDVQSDPSGNVYLTGESFDSFDADPGSGVSNFTPIGTKDMFLVKLTSEGNFIFVKQFGLSRYTLPGNMCIDGSGNIFIRGLFDATLDVDPGPGVLLITPVFSYNAFAIKLSPNGRLLWAHLQRSSSQMSNAVIAIDVDNQIHLAGTYGAGISLGNNIFLQGAFISGVYLARFADANNILGNVYYDSNANSVKELSEIGLSGVMVEAESGPLTFYAISDSLGDYNIIADTGSYNISVDNIPNYYSASLPDSQLAIFGRVLGKVDSLNNFGLVPELNKSDLRVHITNITRARPGSDASYQIAYKNVGTTIISGTISLQHPANLLFEGSIPNTTSNDNSHHNCYL